MPLKSFCQKETESLGRCILLPFIPALHAILKKAVLFPYSTSISSLVQVIFQQMMEIKNKRENTKQ